MKTSAFFGNLLPFAFARQAILFPFDEKVFKKSRKSELAAAQTADFQKKPTELKLLLNI